MFLIACIYALGYHTGFVDDIEDMIKRRVRFFRIPKPFSCPLCMTWWTNLIYVLVCGPTLLNVLLALIFALTTEIIPSAWELLKSFYYRVVEDISNYFHLNDY